MGRQFRDRCSQKVKTPLAVALQLRKPISLVPHYFRDGQDGTHTEKRSAVHKVSESTH